MAKRDEEDEGVTPKMKAKAKARPIVRLGIFLISHSLFFSVACCVSGVLALLLLPVLAKNTYISENAFMPGSASTMLSNLDVLDGSRLVKDLTTSNMKSSDAGMGSRRLIVKYMLDLDAEVSYHRFNPQPRKFHPVQFFSNPDSGIMQENLSCQSYGVNIVGIIRAPRGDGKESIILVTPYNDVKNGLHDALSIGIAYSVFSLLSKVNWLAKDIIWLVADSRHEDYAPVAAWLRDYHIPKFSSSTQFSESCHDASNFYDFGGPETGSRISDGFRRAGTMAAALVFKVSGSNEFEDSISIYAEASNGQMPNLDLINIVNYLAVHRQGLRVKVNKFWSLLDNSWLRILGEIFEFIGRTARNLNPGWKFGIPATDYVDGAATLASSMYYQALGVPTGPHGAFRDFQIDAITLEISQSFSSDRRTVRSDFLWKGGRLIEGVMRSVNNLLEKFHQSFFLYLLTSPGKFVSVGVYMIAFALIIIAPLPVVAASLYLDANQVSLGGDTSTHMAAAACEVDLTFKSWKWLSSARTVFVIHLWGAFTSLAPYFMYDVQSWNPTAKFFIWVSLSALSLLILYFAIHASHSVSSQTEGKDWALLKSVTIAAAFIGLGIMSIFNFATAEISALLLVPLCLMVRPVKLDLKAGSLTNISRLICISMFAVFSFPPVAFLVFEGVFEGFDGSIVGDFWNWLESLWAWNSATYLYIGVVHLPCWVLCLHIMFH